MTRDEVIKGLEQFITDFKPFCGNKADWQKIYDALALLKAQEAKELIVAIEPVELSVDEIKKIMKHSPIYVSDRVNVVRCRDCKFGKLYLDADGHRLIQCNNPNYPTANVETWPLELDWYCAGGKRRDGDT